MLALAAAGLLAPGSALGAGGRSPPARALIAFVAAPGPGAGLAALGRDRRVQALGLLNPSQGNYNEQQALLDLTQGARVSDVVYGPQDPPALGLSPAGRVSGWARILARARRTSAQIEPGLLAATVPGGAAYAGAGSAGAEAVLAADAHGRVDAVSLGSSPTLARRTQALLGRYELVVAAVPDLRALDRLLARRTAHELVLILEAPPATRPAQERKPELLAIGASGLPGGGGTLGSPTTRLPGLVTGLDIAPTVLRWLGRRLPAAIHGQAITRTGSRDPAGLERFAGRLAVIAGRRWPTITAFLLAWLGLIVLAAGLRRARGARAGLRLGGLAALWTPCTMLVAGALAPTRPVEIAVILGGAFGLALANDLLIAWPRAPVVPAAAMVVAYVVDLALGSPLIAASLIGPDPIAGGRFYGVGNELEAALPIVLFAGLAAGLPQARTQTRDAGVFAGIGVLLTVLVAWGRLGADVGAVFTIGGGTAAGALMLGRRPKRRTVVLACAAPFVGLLALAGLDLSTGAGGHYTESVLHAGSAADVLDTIRRKLEAAFRELRKGVMPLNTVVCLAGGAYAMTHLDRVLRPVGEAAGWRALVVGGFVAGVAGSVTNDSGPVLLVIATFGLGCVLAYVWGGRPGEPSYPPLQRS